MDRTRVWPEVEDPWIVHEDENLVVVDKPSGVSTLAADPAHPDDLVTRLRTRYPYLGVHQRLDKDTSGLLVFARRREANASLAKQFEGREVEKRYVAAVTGWTRGNKVTLRDRLVEGKDGRVVVGRGPGGKDAVTHVTVLARRGERTLLELTLETGRTHQARVQLAHAGSPITGDSMYGGAAAPRLLLHAKSLAFRDPMSAAPRRFEAKVPEEFRVWVDRGDLGAAVYDDEGALRRAIALAFRRRYALGRAGSAPQATTAFRVIHELGDGLPELAVDVYGDHLVVQLYGTDGAFADRARRERVLDQLFALGASGVYLKVRPKQANVIVDPRRDEFAPPLPVRGSAAADPLIIHEEGATFGVRLGDGLSTGIFLDQRRNRRLVRELAPGRRVLNLFAYTCGFSVVAALGGARGTVSVDASVAALERGRENLALAGFTDTKAHELVADDAFHWLARAARQRERFDLVILDPPSYSTTKHRRFVAKTDYAELAAAALALLAPGGRLLACSNHRGIPRHKLRRMLFDAARAARVDVAQVKDLPDPVDFPPAPGAEPTMKSALVTLR